MAAATRDSIAYYLKEVWPIQEIQKQLFGGSPWAARMPKDTNMTGDPQAVAAMYGMGGGTSTNFDVAKATKRPTKGIKWQISPVELYSLFSVSGLAQALSEGGNKGALEDAISTEFDAKLTDFNRKFEVNFYGNGVGTLAQVSASATLASTTLLLRDPRDAIKFEVGDYVELSSDNTGVAGVRVGMLRVESVDIAGGALVLEGNTSTIPGAATSDYIYLAGTYNDMFAGVGGWLPITAPSATPWFQVDRTLDILRLGGIRVDYSTSNYTIEEMLKRAISRAADYGARPKSAYINTERFTELDLTISSNRMFIEKVDSVGLEYEGFTVSGPKGPVKVFGDPLCPYDRGYVVEDETWKMMSVGSFPRIESGNGKDLRLEENADAREGRIKAYFNIVCKGPGRNLVFKIS